MNIFINAPSYDDSSGGAIVLHRLCHLINEKTEHKAFLIPLGYPLKKWLKKIRFFLRGSLNQPKNYQIRPGWNTPIWNKLNIPKDSVAIYPEIINGNPFSVDHVVRWLLHQPGFHTGSYQYGSKELFFKFNSAIKDFYHEGSKLSKRELKIIYYPIDIYNNDYEEERTIESCHLIRKGKYKKFIHSENSIGLDGKSHKEFAEIFRKSKKFICYDDYTAYSIFAVLCGCQSIVVPDDNVAIDEWYPNPSDRYGIAYGVTPDQLNWAEKTKGYVLNHILEEHKRAEQCVISCLKEIQDYFYQI